MTMSDAINKIEDLKDENKRLVQANQMLQEDKSMLRKQLDEAHAHMASLPKPDDNQAEPMNPLEEIDEMIGGLYPTEETRGIATPAELHAVISYLECKLGI